MEDYERGGRAIDKKMRQTSDAYFTQRRKSSPGGSSIRNTNRGSGGRGDRLDPMASTITEGFNVDINVNKARAGSVDLKRAIANVN